MWKMVYYKKKENVKKRIFKFISLNETYHSKKKRKKANNNIRKKYLTLFNLSCMNMKTIDQIAQVKFIFRHIVAFISSFEIDLRIQKKKA